MHREPYGIKLYMKGKVGGIALSYKTLGLLLIVLTLPKRCWWNTFCWNTFCWFIVYLRIFSPCAGYANEVGEAFRSQVHVNVVRFSYLIASSYVCADAYSKGKVAAKVNNRLLLLNLNLTTFFRPFPWAHLGVILGLHFN